MFEGNNQGFISGENTIPLILPVIIIKEKIYQLVGGICSPTVIHFMGFL